jgi:hypothetical protein
LVWMDRTICAASPPRLMVGTLDLRTQYSL